MVVEYLGGIDDLPAIVADFAPARGRRLGVLVDHLVPGSKESRIADEVRRRSGGEYVSVLGHPYIDIWQAVKPGRLGLAAWPQIPRGTDWKHGICAALGWPHRDQADIAAAWQVILGRVESWDDLERPLLTTVEQLFDFVTQDHTAILELSPAGRGPPRRPAAGPRSVSVSRSSATSARPRATRSGTRRDSVAVSTSSGSPSASRSSSSTRSVRRSSAVSTSRAYAGERSAASRSAYALGCLTFHQRTPPTWLCAPGPTPHQWSPRQ